MKKKPKLIHCSFDVITSFEPRVPTSRTDFEDDKIKRICVTPTIRQCLTAMPRAGESIRWILSIGMPVVIHAYYLEADRVEYDTKEYVLDAEITDEFWILEKPKDWKRIDYEITSCSLIDSKDIYGKPMVKVCNVSLRRTAYTDNLRELIEGSGMDYDDFRKNIPDVSFGLLARNHNEELAELIREKRKAYISHKNFENLQRRLTAYREKFPKVEEVNIWENEYQKPI